jgi:hypothetical protein
MRKSLTAQELLPSALHHHGCHTQTDRGAAGERKQRNPHGVLSDASVSVEPAENSEAANPFRELCLKSGNMAPFCAIISVWGSLRSTIA